MSTDQELLEGMLKTGGWGAFENLAEKAKLDQGRMIDEAKAEAGVVLAALSTPQGKKFLHWLISKTLLRPPGAEELSAQTAEQYAIAKAQREGQNGIIFMILRAMDVAREK